MIWEAVSTIQFVATLQAVTAQLRQEGYTVTVPQGKKLDPFLLFCTEVDFFFCPSCHPIKQGSESESLKGLSQEMDLAFEDMHGQF
jgi:hypothetical protein